MRLVIGMHPLQHVLAQVRLVHPRKATHEQPFRLHPHPAPLRRQGFRGFRRFRGFRGDRDRIAVEAKRAVFLIQASIPIHQVLPFPIAERFPKGVALPVAGKGHQGRLVDALGPERLLRPSHQRPADSPSPQFRVHGRVVDIAPPAIVAAEDAAHQAAAGKGAKAGGGVP